MKIFIIMIRRHEAAKSMHTLVLCLQENLDLLSAAWISLIILSISIMNCYCYDFVSLSRVFVESAV